MAATTESATDIPVSDQPSTSKNVRVSAAPRTRKRTKTGCLTCRKRRIKCGEERPICHNCTKSKRNCEGYTPRVIWKDPQGSFRLGDGSGQDHIPHYHEHSQHRFTDHYVSALPTATGQASFPPLRPRPPLQGYPYRISQDSLFSPQIIQPRSRGWSFGGDQSFYTHSLQPATIQDSNHAYAPANGVGHFPEAAHTNGPITTKREKISDHLDNVGHSDHYTNTNIDSVPALTGWTPDLTNPSTSPEGHTAYMRYRSDQTSAKPVYSQPRAGDPQHLETDHVSQQFSDYPYESFPIDPQWTTASPPFGRTLTDPSKTPCLEVNGHDRMTYDGYVNTAGDIAVPKYAFAPQNRLNNHWQQVAPHDNILGAHKNLQSLQAPVFMEDPEDDYFDVDSDEETEISQGQLAAKQQTDLGLMLALSAHRDERSIRSVTSFLNGPDILATYQPTFSASPLMDPQTARVFCHFVTSTAPSLSIYERRPGNPSVMFTEHPVPLSQQNIWTYTLPMMALSHRGLLHAMLALASFHIAKLQRTSTSPSLKHYQYALTRIAKAVGLPNKRPSIATLAASMLLGYYEVSAADHRKWNSHLAGARQLLMELDFIGMTRRVKAHKAEAEARDRYYAGFVSQLQPSYLGFGNGFNDTSTSNEDKLDENLISIFVGQKVRSDQHGRIIDGNGADESNRRPLTPKDIEHYEIQRDLFWWYAKQDLYQSMVSGNRLLMPYYRLASCPPRATMGRIDAVCGTMDHMILLMARIADFIGKDQPRKIRMMRANGGQWIPPPGMFSSSARGPPQQQPPTPQSGTPTNFQPSGSAFRAANQAAPPTPTFYGMLPTASEPIQLPPGFAQTRADYINPNKSPTDHIELDAATREAEIEWNDLRNALRVFEEHVGLDYQPLSPEYMQPIATPFGPAICYRTYSISCLWALYYTGRIITARAHPCMPPAAMMAAGIAAPQTAEWANNIGRICAGLHPTTTVGPINPSLAAALSEISLTLFFAGVQYREAAQRGWTVTALRNIARLTGWQSSSLIAAGCEVTWSKLAQAGRGPPYTATMEPTSIDDRVAGRRGELDAEAPKDLSDRRLIAENAGTRVHWAMGIMSAEEDMAKLSLSV